MLRSDERARSAVARDGTTYQGSRASGRACHVRACAPSSSHVARALELDAPGPAHAGGDQEKISLIDLIGRFSKE